jgi:hypothetical protein
LEAIPTFPHPRFLFVSKTQKRDPADRLALAPGSFFNNKMLTTFLYKFSIFGALMPGMEYFS